jgi:chemotaxis protein MotB
MRKKKKEDSGFNVWRSYSDMMAGVLLLFVLIMCVTLFQAQKSYNESIEERDEKIALQQEYTLQILQQQNELEEQAGQLDEQAEELQSKDELLSQQEQLLKDLIAEMEQQKKTLDSQQVALDEQTTLLAEQQERIDKIIGVKAGVVASLQKEFEENNVSVDLDSQTGALILDANVMFAYDDAELTEEGKTALREILPIYLKVLLNEENEQYLAEIMIEGYTDPDGDYSYNMELSQRRSLAVAQYLVEIQSEFLDDAEIEDLESYLTVNGHSRANPVLDDEGNVDKDASRRVEVKFRLKDDEMISELNEIMSDTTQSDTTESDTSQADTTQSDTTKSDASQTDTAE